MSRRDVEFLLYDVFDVLSLIDRPRYAAHDRTTFDGVLDVAQQLAEEVFAPINRLLDETEPTVGPDGSVVQPTELAAALARYAETGLTAATFDDELGGIQLPYSVFAACSAFLQAGSIATFAYPALSHGNAHLVATFGSSEQIDRFARPVIEGRWFGTMCLSEPHAGSSLADITTMARRQDDGTYRISGSKMWISGGDHDLTGNIVHLVLAKTPHAEPGAKGISLFIVPKRLLDDGGALGERNDVLLAGLNHKMGYRGTTNALLSFGSGEWTPRGQAGAVGYLVGDEGRGLEYMFLMMNAARLGVGSGAMAIGYTGYLHSLDYARTRPQGRPFGERDARSSQVPIVAHPDVRRMLLAQKAYVEGALALVLFCARLIDDAATAGSVDERAEAEMLLGLLTPIVKSWPSEWGLKANELAIQVLGGYGYARDFPVEQFYRDNRLNMIHEGTHGIQALDLLGRKILRNDQAWGVLRDKMRGDIRIARRRGHALQAHGDALADQADAVDRVTEAVRAMRPDIAMANATDYMEAFGHVVVGWLWLRQEIASDGQEGVFYDGKRAASDYFFTHELAKVPAWLGIVECGDQLTLDLDPDVL